MEPQGGTGNRITVLYDAFGSRPGCIKDWGFAALVEFAVTRWLGAGDLGTLDRGVPAHRVPLEDRHAKHAPMTIGPRRVTVPRSPRGACQPIFHRASEMKPVNRAQSLNRCAQ